jgi:hypothetical protein
MNSVPTSGASAIAPTKLPSRQQHEPRGVSVAKRQRAARVARPSRRTGRRRNGGTSTR